MVCCWIKLFMAYIYIYIFGIIEWLDLNELNGLN